MVTKMRIFVPILILVNVAAILFINGCTLGGLHFGSKIDRVNTDTTTVSLESLTYDVYPDTCEIEKNDHVLILLNSGQSLEGKVKEIDRGNTITLAVKRMKHSSYSYSRRVEVQWTEIQSISVIHKPYLARLILTTVGAAIDIWVIVAIVEIAVELSKPPFGGIGGG
jgi:hypothetical protein